MIPELGQLCLVIALLTSLLQAGVPLVNRFNQPHNLLHLTKSTATALFLLVSSAFAALLYAYIASDFSVLNVILNSHSSKPLIYKIVGAWGNHEGSMLLWMWVLATCGFLVAILPAADKELRATTLAVLGLISAGLLAFILFTSNPFLRVFPAPLDGEDLNPILQDIGLALHPPTLYVGYVGFGVAFAYAIAGMLLKRIDSAWAKAVHPWILLPWMFLTLGIAAGSWWAYRELGWGGWWFWDPVENVSLLPWLVGTALFAFEHGTRKTWAARALGGVARHSCLHLLTHRHLYCAFWPYYLGTCLRLRPHARNVYSGLYFCDQRPCTAGLWLCGYESQ